MESKKDVLKRIKFENLTNEASDKLYGVCNFKSCDYCQGRPIESYINRKKRDPIKKKTYNPKAPEKKCSYK